ncbi:MAG: TylF/MycF/NovP-related O-methyltransferase [Pseudomonadota bacterium]
MANFISDSHFSVRDKPRFVQGMVDTIESVAPDGIFASDNLLTWGRNLGFLEDGKFLDAIVRHDPDKTEEACIWRLHTLCWAARQCSRLEGDFVEAGVYRGFSVRVICDYLGFGELDKGYFLYDLFMHEAGMPQHSLPDHGEGLYQRVCRRFEDLPRVRVIEGRVPESFSQAAPEKIAFMHIDMNNAEAEVATLTALYDRIVPGGMVIFDDYGWRAYGAQKVAEDAWLAERHFERILELPTGQGLLIKI